MDQRIQKLKELIEKDKLAYMIEFSKNYQNDTEYILKLHGESAIFTNIKPGKKYTKVDIGHSGTYMVVNDTGEIFGIKAYGVIHKGHQYGTLDTINDWNWGGYTATKKN